MTSRGRRSEWHQANQPVSRWRRWAFEALVTALTVQIALGCRSTAPRPAPTSPETPATTLPAVTQRATLTASLTPSPTLTSPPAPSATWTPGPQATNSSDGDAQGSLTDVSATLRSLQKVDDYPLYTMRYHGAYTRTASLACPDGWATSPTRGPAWACSLFAALGDAEQRVYGRSFDWRYSPALLLFTDPPGGYASVSMVDIAYLVDLDEVDHLMALPLERRRVLLETPFWPFDGMNEAGLAVGMAAVPETEMPHDPHKQTIDSLRVIREMLDHARDVEEAIGLLGSYNVTWDGGPPLHYLIADASGRSVLIEFVAGRTVLIPNPDESPWHLATNHLRSTVRVNSPSGCWRYDAIHRELERTEGRLTATAAMNLLADVAQESTQWSVVYDLSTRRVHATMGRAYERRQTFRLGSNSPRPAEATTD